jgi:hypothetical protein
MVGENDFRFSENKTHHGKLELEFETLRPVIVTAIITVTIIDTACSFI